MRKNIPLAFAPPKELGAYRSTSENLSPFEGSAKHMSVLLSERNDTVS